LVSAALRFSEPINLRFDCLPLRHQAFSFNLSFSLSSRSSSNTGMVKLFNTAVFLFPLSMAAQV